MPRSPLFHPFNRLLRQAHQKNLLNAAGSQRVISAWTRRRFIRRAALAFGGVVASQAVARLGVAQSSTSPTVAIIGGGLAGLNAAYQLQKAGIQATVYEARGRLGGRMYTQTDVLQAGQYLDFGGSFINSGHEDLLSLVEELGLELIDLAQTIEASPFPATGFYFGQASRTEAEIAESLRPLAQQIAADANLLDEDFEQYAPLLDQLSVADYLNQHQDKIPEPLIRALINSVIQSEYGVESSQSSALQLIFALPATEGDTVNVLSNVDEAYTVDGGSGQVIDRLSQKLSGQIQLRKCLTKVEAEQSGFQLTFADGDGVAADYVILTVPPAVLRNIDLAVELPSDFKRFIQAVDLGKNDKLFAQFDEKVWRQADGFVDQVWCDGPFAVGWEATTPMPHRTEGTLVFFYGGEQSEALQTESTRSQGEKALEVLEAFIPESRSAATQQFVRTHWFGEPYTQGAYANFKPGQLSEFAQFLYYEADDPEERQDVAFGGLVFAGELFSDEYYGYMNGAAQTGRLAADVILRQL
ncbi:MAG: FAD-dependent oxidoreductase [Leptolyngbya sp. SIO1E4]|nr:FAD-dependent oxidoreductase [Leptolyngbya sp. SIO1E4]